MDTSRVWTPPHEDQRARPDPEETVAVWTGTMSLAWSQVGTDFSGRMSRELQHCLQKDLASVLSIKTHEKAVMVQRKGHDFPSQLWTTLKIIAKPDA